MKRGDGADSIVVIVLNWCGESDTIACIESLRASERPVTILLIDNASPDGSGERLHARYPEVPYVQTAANLGYTGGNNAGFRWALEHGADYVVVLNNDTVVDAGCIGALVDAAESRPGVGGVAPKILYFDDPGRIWFGGGDFSRLRVMGLHRGEGALDDARSIHPPEPITFMTGCCILFPAPVLRELGGFDDAYFAYMEDVELCVRLRSRGYTMLYQPAARVLHRIAPVAEPSAFQIRQRDRNRRRLAAQHLSPLARAAFGAWFYPTRLAHLARYAATLDWARSRAILDGLFARV